MRIVGADDEVHEAALVTAFVKSLDPVAVRAGDVGVLARTNRQVEHMSAALTAAGVPIARRQLAPGSPLAAAVATATRLPSAWRLRGWAHDALDAAPEAADEAADDAERQVAGAVLEFLREQPSGDGASLRGWLAATRPFAVDEQGVEPLTFHAAKGREWPTVVITGAETGSVPHRSATTIAARAEEVRLLHVAITRASERLVITWAARRGGYRRQPSPLITGIDTVEPTAVRPPPELRSRPPVGSGAAARLAAWRDSAARAAMVLPAEICTDADLVAIAAADPATPDELAAASSLGGLTAARLFPGIRAALDG